MFFRKKKQAMPAKRWAVMKESVNFIQLVFSDEWFSLDLMEELLSCGLLVRGISREPRYDNKLVFVCQKTSEFKAIPDQ